MTANSPLNALVDTLRDVAATLGRAVEEGRHASTIDARDLIETLLTIADRLDPPVEP